jgi:hypothetical protein
VITHILPQESTFTSSAILPGTFGDHRIRSGQNTSGSINFICSRRSCLPTRSGNIPPRCVSFSSRLHRNFRAEYIPFPKFRKRLPTILSPEEVGRLIDSAGNLFHRTLIMTLYSTAMRRAELCRLKVSDIDSQRMMIRIEQGKGGRDHEVPLSPTLLKTLRVYLPRRSGVRMSQGAPFAASRSASD